MNRKQWLQYQEVMRILGRLKIAEETKLKEGTIFFGVTRNLLSAHTYVKDKKAFHVVYDQVKNVVMAHWEDPDVTTVVGSFFKMFPEYCDSDTVANLLTRGFDFPFSEWKDVPDSAGAFAGLTLEALTPADRFAVDPHQEV